MKWYQSLLAHQTIALVLVVIVFLAVDDLLMLLFIQHFEVIRLSDWSYHIVHALIFLSSLVIALLVVKALRRKPVTGEEGLTGARGSVLNRTGVEYQVQIQGEIWQALCDEALLPGEDIVVDSVDGLRLRVRKIAPGDER